MTLLAELDRCDRELVRLKKEVLTSPDTHGVLLGLHDWWYEKRLIKQEISQIDLAIPPTQG